jgi:hypothetical protein
MILAIIVSIFIGNPLIPEITPPKIDLSKITPHPVVSDDSDIRSNGVYQVAGLNKSFTYKKIPDSLMGNISDLHLKMDTDFMIVPAGIDTFSGRFYDFKTNPTICQKFFIANTSPKVLRMRYTPVFVMQAKDNSGVWEDIELEEYPWCATGIKSESIPPGKYILLASIIYKGNFKTKLRLRYDKIYSKEFDGSINPLLFIKVK